MDGHSVPLGATYESFAGTITAERGYRKVLTIWSAIRAEVEGKGSQSAFIKSLTKPQRQTLACLLEWWSGEIDPSRDIDVLITAINEHANGPKGQDKLDLSNLAIARERPWGYHVRLAQLFASEFYDYPQGRPVPVYSRRNEAGLAAPCQRVGYLTSKNLQISPGSPSTILSALGLAAIQDCLPNAVLEPCHWLADDKKRGLPYYLWDIEAQRTVAVKDLPEPPTYTIISHTWGRWRVPSTQLDATIAVHGIPWLVPRNTRFDIQALPGILASHTAVFSPTKFIWFDLFCIPQDRSAIAVDEIARQAAIFGAAERALCWLNTIEDWSGLRASVQWLALASYSHSQRDGGIKAMINREILKELTKSTGLFETFTQHVPEFETIALGNDLCGWFTSLWTLQEVCLRPDMILFNKNWEPLRLFDDNSALQIPLDTILALSEYIGVRVSDLITEYPPAVTELMTLIEGTSLARILDCNPLSILAIADHRECKKRRAEAIMSVVGATDWYLGTPQELHEQNLILGRYPIQFLREVRQKEGARFFTSQYGTDCCFWDIFCAEERDVTKTREIIPYQTVFEEVSTRNIEEESEWEDVEDDGAETNTELRVAGTMLPFDPRRSQSKWISRNVPKDTHPTVATWVLDDDGAVLMREVAIVASTDHRLDDGTDQRLKAHVIGPSEQSPSKMVIHESTNLHDYLCKDLASFGYSAYKHAVPVIKQNDGFIQGVILIQIDGPKQDNEQQRTLMGKLGDFLVSPGNHTTSFREWNVDWAVL